MVLLNPEEDNLLSRKTANFLRHVCADLKTEELITVKRIVAHLQGMIDRCAVEGVSLALCEQAQTNDDIVVAVMEFSIAGCCREVVVIQPSELMKLLCTLKGAKVRYSQADLVSGKQQHSLAGAASLLA